VTISFSRNPANKLWRIVSRGSFGHPITMIKATFSAFYCMFLATAALGEVSIKTIFSFNGINGQNPQGTRAVRASAVSAMRKSALVE
jgi:hypothetical protein